MMRKRQELRSTLLKVGPATASDEQSVPGESHALIP